MDMESRYGLMVQCTLATGKIVRLPVKVNLLISMETSTKVNGSTTKLMALVYTVTEMEASTLGHGRMINLTVLVLNPGLTIPSMKEVIALAAKMDLAFISGKMKQSTRDNGKIIRSQALVSMSGSMAVAIKASGKIIIWTALESISGKTAVFIKENISKIKSMVMVYSIGKMEESMLATGPMVNSMASEFMKSQTKASRSASGNLAKSFNGLLKNKNIKLIMNRNKLTSIHRKPN